MFRKVTLKRGLLKRARKISSTNIDLSLKDEYANFFGSQHNMVVEGEVFQEVHNKTFDELAPLEKADLTDFWIGEHGADKKRRNLLRRP